MPTLDTAIVYPGMCLFEATNVSESKYATTKITSDQKARLFLRKRFRRFKVSVESLSFIYTSVLQ